MFTTPKHWLLDALASLGIHPTNPPAPPAELAKAMDAFDDGYGAMDFANIKTPQFKFVPATPDILAGGWVVCGPKSLAYDMLVSVLPNDVTPTLMRQISHQTWRETYKAAWSWRGQRFGVSAETPEELRTAAHRMMLRVDMGEAEWAIFEGYAKAKGQ